MDLKELQHNFNKFGQTTPLETVVYNRKKWDADKFFATGEQEVQDLAEYVRSLDLEFPQGIALDFGCGVGRVTQPLAGYFDICYGVDIAPSMITLANQYNRYGAKCRFILNETDDLEIFPDRSLNFIYSVITLQNMEPCYSRKYVQEFTRILAVDGLLIFQIPDRPKTLRMALKERLPRFLRSLLYKVKYRGQPWIELHGIPRQDIVRLLEENGMKIIDVQPDQRAFREWSSFQYCATK